MEERPPAEVRAIRWMSVSLKNTVGRHLGNATSLDLVIGRGGFPVTLFLWLGVEGNEQEVAGSIGLI